MNIQLRELASRVAQATRFEPEVQEEIKLEIESHLADEAQELALSGTTPDEATRQVIVRFGDPQAVGRELALAKRPWARLPLIGPLIYYWPLRMGMKLFFLQIGALVSWAVGLIVVNTIASFVTAAFASAYLLFWLMPFIIAIPLAYNFAIVRWLLRITTTRGSAWEIWVISELPFFIWFVMDISNVALRLLTQGKSPLLSEGYGYMYRLIWTRFEYIIGPQFILFAIVFIVCWTVRLSRMYRSLLTTKKQNV